MPFSGKLISLLDVPDEVFSDKIMGDGFAIILNDNSVIAPVSGIVRSVFPSGHAIVLETEAGVGVLIHLGLSTHLSVGLYKPLVKKDQLVQQGDLLIKVNLKKAKRQKVNLKSPIVFLTQEEVIIHRENEMVQQGDSDVITILNKL